MRSPGSSAVVELDQVTKRYGAGAQTVAAVSDLTLRVQMGEFVSVMGPSGCGKTSLLHLIAGFDTPDCGRIVVGGHNLAQLSDDARSDFRLRNIGFVFQNFNLFPTFTVEENVAWPLEMLRARPRDARTHAQNALDRVGISRSAGGRLPAALSGGEQQRVAIARALVTDPMLLVADEPTGNLDSRNGQAILDLLRALNGARELTVLMVTHSTFAATYGHRTIELRDGRITREIRAPRESARVVPLRE
jgi:putative ABC transport system ATP-binding protein